MAYSKSQATFELISKWPNAGELRHQYPEFADLLRGEFENPDPDKINFYPNGSGLLVSRRLIQGETLEPSVGIVFPGEYRFNLTKGNREIFIILEGELEAAVNNALWSNLRAGGAIVIDPGNTLCLSAADYAFYMCRYEPRKK